jgi:hypothetical protein
MAGKLKQGKFKMKINIKDDAKINSALVAINGRSASFCYTAAHEIRTLADRAEKILSDRGVYKKHATGSTLTAMKSGATAKRYKYSANATRVTMAKTSGGWFLTGVEMGTVYPLEKEVFALTVSPDAGADIIARAMSDISVREV